MKRCNGIKSQRIRHFKRFDKFNFFKKKEWQRKPYVRKGGLRMLIYNSVFLYSGIVHSLLRCVRLSRHIYKWNRWEEVWVLGVAVVLAMAVELYA